LPIIFIRLLKFAKALIPSIKFIVTIAKFLFINN